MARHKRGLRGYGSAVAGAVTGNVLTLGLAAGAVYYGYRRLGGAEGIAEKVGALVQTVASSVSTKVVELQTRRVSPRGVPASTSAGEDATTLLAAQNAETGLPGVGTDPLTAQVVAATYENAGGLGGLGTYLVWGEMQR